MYDLTINKDLNLSFKEKVNFELKICKLRITISK